MAYLDELDSKTGLIGEVSRVKGQDLREQYRKAAPFPHVVIDDFLPSPVLDRMLTEFPAGDDAAAAALYDRAQERFKAQYNPDGLPQFSRQLFYTFSSLPFIRLLENITGINGLMPDPYFFGGGFHELRQGGHLSVHADFNRHQQMNLQRRINVLIYLNKDWRDEYGGHLELWDEAMTACQLSFAPHFNRCVIFNTDQGNNHGNPTPIDHPKQVSRKSIALYYYTATWNAAMRDRTTQFRVRPGSDDKRDWGVRVQELFFDMLPPLAFRALQRMKHAAIGR
jgi:Rps23 Pro-64 3,4-dihydroxylase Tpa1-like proline 4-hydroxylase